MAKNQDMGEYAFTYKGLKVYRKEEFGEVYYCAMNGSDYACDNENCIEGVEGSIDAYWSETQHGELNGFFE